MTIRLNHKSLAIKIALLFASFGCLANCNVITNIKGQTLLQNENKVEKFDWMVFKNGKVIEIGKNRIKTLYASCNTIDGKGAHLLPGLIDAHGHISSLGNEMLRVKLRNVGSEQLAAEAVLQFAKANTKSQWILGRGWNQVIWDNNQFPTKHSLDKTGLKRPIVLRRIDGHAAWVNSVALKMAGITASTPDPQGGKIIRDDKGHATGVLIDNAIFLVENKIPKATFLEQDYAFDKAFEHLLSLGITSAHDAGVSALDLSIYKQRAESNRLPVRVYGMLDGSSTSLNSWLESGHVYDSDDFLSVRSVKLYSDGALGSRGAALLAPYSDDVDNKGLLLTKPTRLNELVEKIMSKGFQVNVHAIGDRGNQLVLDSFEKAYKTTNGRDLRNRIEHSQIVTLEDIPRFKSLDIIASMQPVHATSDKNMAGDRLGSFRLKGAYAWQKFIQQGTIIASGSDFPVELANIFHGLHAAVTRQDRNNLPQGGWLPDERMTSIQALRSFTLDAAYSAHQENKIGTLEKGKWADFILVDRDIISGDSKDIWKTNVLQTWVAGKLAFNQVN